MTENLTLKGEALGASLGGTLEAEQFLNESYRLRRNVLNGKVEFATLNAEETYRPLTQEALNSIFLRAKREGLFDAGVTKSDFTDYIYSEDVPLFDPMVAHWLQMDTLHGNECVPTLIGAQGCGKTTFLRRLLPQPLRQYYLDHLNLSNKFDKEMALTNNLLVNLDELEAVRPSQHAALKQTLSKSKVNGRPIFGRAQEDRPRYASFTATTNNPHPLTDATGSRRYICLHIPQGQFINNSGDIDYDQLYAQVLYELREQKAPYWFNNDEVARIQQLNLGYMEQKDIAEIVAACFRKPKAEEAVKALNSQQLLEVIKKEYPSLPATHSTKVHLGLAMKELGFERISRGNQAFYKAVPQKAA